MSFSRDEKHVERLRRSFRIVGPLQRTLREKGTSRILVGRHRKFAVSNWSEKSVKVESPLHRELIIVHGQVERGLPDQEARIRVNRIANILVSPSNQDKKYLAKIVSKDQLAKLEEGIPQCEICNFIVKNELAPWSEQHIRRLIGRQFRMLSKARTKKSANISSQPATLEEAAKKGAEIRESLEDLESHAPKEERELPYPNCLCKKCPHLQDCY